MEDSHSPDPVQYPTADLPLLFPLDHHPTQPIIGLGNTAKMGQGTNNDEIAGLSFTVQVD
jgi:hypothetical protein